MLSFTTKSGGVWKSPHTRLVPQPPNPHFRRLSMSEDTLHHIIRWNVELSAAHSYTTQHYESGALST
jgi:hypothetical protein